MSETEISARRTRIGIPPGGAPPSSVIAASMLISAQPTIGDEMTARGTDWSLALLVALLLVSGLGPGSPATRATHGCSRPTGSLGAALAVLLAWKLPRVWRRLWPRRWDRRTIAGALALLLVASTLISGWMWASAGALSLAGFSLIAWHTLLGGLLGIVVIAHLICAGEAPTAP